MDSFPRWKDFRRAQTQIQRRPCLVNGPVQGTFPWISNFNFNLSAWELHYIQTKTLHLLDYRPEAAPT